MKRSVASPFFPSAVFFDFDGIIVDTEPLHYAAFTEVLEPEGLAFSRQEYDTYYMGFDDRDAVDTAAQAKGIRLADDVRRRLLETKVQTFSRLTRETPLKPFPGILPLIRALRERNIPIALCSGALRLDIEPILERLGLMDAFLIRVTADDVPRSKPDPASYRLAHQRLCRRLGVELPARQCLAIEDTPAGIASAHGAGLVVLGVATSGPAEALADAEVVVSTLDKWTPDDLSQCMP